MQTDDTTNQLERVRKLAEEVAAFLDLEPPSLLREERVEPEEERPWYLIGLIGGKEVGKSALINALVGKEIASTSAYGPGTEKVLAYVHNDQADSVHEYLLAAIGNKFEIVRHGVDETKRQVLLDLPDMDSHFSDHVELSRKMVRLMEYPIWIASVEKYADAEPAKLLKEVARGNSPENFVFCLNKVDQAHKLGGDSAVQEIGDDYAQRIGRALDLEFTPQVRLISAVHPEEGDLPALRKQLSQDKSAKEVDRSRRLALERRCESLLAWIDRAGLSERAERLERFLSLAESELRERVGATLYGRTIPRIESDGALRAELTHRVHQFRSGRWPFVNLLDVALGSVARLVQFRSPFRSAETIDRLEPLIAKEFSRGNPNLKHRLESTLARIQAAQPDLFKRLSNAGPEKEWNTDKRIAGLQDSFLLVLENRETETERRLLKQSSSWGRLWRLLLTLGAVVWFPLGQPLLLAYLSEEGLRSIPLALVALFGVSHLLQSAALLAVYFILLWAIVRWNAGRKVERLFAQWRDPGNSSTETSLYGAAEVWLSDLVLPVRDYWERVCHFKREYEQLAKPGESVP